MKGNSIKDEGVQLLMDALDYNESIRVLDISLNEITPIGFSYLFDILPRTKIRKLILGKNFLGDESLINLGDCIKENPAISLVSIDISTSRISDTGFLYLLEVLSTSKNSIQKIKIEDNFISDKVEKFLVGLLQKMKKLHSLKLSGNRLSLGCLTRIESFLNKNIKDEVLKEPKKLQSQIFILEYEKKKIEHKMRLREKAENEIKDIEAQHFSLTLDEEQFREGEILARRSVNDKILLAKKNAAKKEEMLRERQEQLENTQNEIQSEMNKIIARKNMVEAKRNELRAIFLENQAKMKAMQAEYDEKILKEKQEIHQKK